MNKNIKLAQNIGLLTDWLVKNEFCDAPYPLYSAQSECQKNKDTEKWKYSISDLVISSLDISKDIKPNNVKSENIKIKLSIYVEGFFQKSDKVKDFIDSLSVQFVFFEQNADTTVDRLSWHLDKHFILPINNDTIELIERSDLPRDKKQALIELKGKDYRIKRIFLEEINNIFGNNFNKYKDELKQIFETDEFCHPEYHFQYGGRTISKSANFNYGDFILIEAPRMMFPPMDIFLSIDFILKNFISKEKHRQITTDPSYIRILNEMKEFIWKPYFFNIASKWDKNIKNDGICSSVMDGEIFN